MGLTFTLALFFSQIQAKYYNNEIPVVCVFFKQDIFIVSTEAGFL